MATEQKPWDINANHGATGKRPQPKRHGHELGTNSPRKNEDNPHRLENYRTWTAKKTQQAQTAENKKVSG